MNANELLDIIGDSRSEYIMDAQKHRSGNTRKRRTPVKRVLLIAAVLAMLVALVGFAAIVFNLDSLKIGGYMAENYMGEQVQMDVISLQGYSGSKNHLAAQEWQEFLQTDVGGAVNNDYRAPREYDAYLCTNKYMTQKVDEICEKYNLELLGPLTIHQSVWETCEAVGMNSIFNTDARYTVETGNGYHFPGGSFEVEAGVVLHDAPWSHPIGFEFRNIQKTAFDGVFIHVSGYSDYIQWNYTTESGAELLMALSSDHAMMFCDRRDSFVTVNIPTPQYGEEYMDKADLEAFADALDFGFTVHPTPVTDDSAEPVTTETPSGTAYYSDYADYINDLLDTGAVLTYALVQVNGIGDDELVIMDGSGIIQEVLIVRDGYVQTMATGGDLYLCDYHELNPIMDVTDPNYRYIYRVIEQASYLDGGMQHYYTAIGERGEGIYIELLKEFDDGTYARESRGHEIGWEIITQEEYEALAGQYERLTLDRKYIGEFFGEHTPDYSLFESVYLPIARGEVPTDWESLQAFITEQGYECRMGEGSYSVRDPKNPDSLLYGDLTTANGIFEAADISYLLVLGDASRTVCTEFTDIRVEYFVNGGFLREGVPVDSLEELEAFIKAIP